MKFLFVIGQFKKIFSFKACFTVSSLGLVFNILSHISILKLKDCLLIFLDDYSLWRLVRKVGHDVVQICRDFWGHARDQEI